MYIAKIRIFNAKYLTPKKWHLKCQKWHLEHHEERLSYVKWTPGKIWIFTSQVCRS